MAFGFQCISQSQKKRRRREDEEIEINWEINSDSIPPICSLQSQETFSLHTIQVLNWGPLPRGTWRFCWAAEEKFFELFGWLHILLWQLHHGLSALLEFDTHRGQPVYIQGKSSVHLKWWQGLQSEERIHHSLQYLCKLYLKFYIGTFIRFHSAKSVKFFLNLRRFYYQYHFVVDLQLCSFSPPILSQTLSQPMQHLPVN